ncbi:hypothetical protein A3F66_06655 [candidate division TM6 bacterium RIFCSPHIGHO2_12_FULL_32_22]|nr:MAG: hypothetical protein A3F66_06655 [candidate division TM6 bacterium RIFCSPHIGHO2_12_FULL_32_22]
MIKKITAIFVIFSINATSWQDILEKNKKLIEDNNCNLLIEQFNSFKSNQAPIIADPKIKSIPIIESDEELIDIKKQNHPRIYMSKHSIGFECGSLIRLSLFEKLKNMVLQLDKLSEYFGFNKEQIDILVFEGLRDITIQEKIFNAKLAEIKLEHPELNEDELELETSKWVSPVKNNVPAHSTGAAIDIRLWDNKNERFVDLGKYSILDGENPNAPTFSEDISDEQKVNRLYLMMASTIAGLINYLYEFWHFSFGDRYYAYWNREIARYGSINKKIIL